MYAINLLPTFEMQNFQAIWYLILNTNLEHQSFQQLFINAYCKAISKILNVLML